MTLPTEYTHCLRLFPAWATPDHVMHVQFSSGVTICQRVLKQMENTSHARVNSVTKWGA